MSRKGVAIRRDGPGELPASTRVVAGAHVLIPPGHLVRSDPRRNRRVEGRIPLKDREFEGAQRGPWFHSELFDEHRAGALICPQSLGLSTNLVQREHQELPPPFTPWVLDDHRLEFGNAVAMHSGVDEGCCAPLL